MGKIIKVNDTPQIVSEIIDHNSVPTSNMDGLLNGMRNEKNIVKRLDREFRKYCSTDRFSEYIEYVDYEIIPVAEEFKDRSVTLKMSYTVPYQFNFITRIYNKKADRIIEKEEHIIQDIPVSYKKYFNYINGHPYISIPQIIDIVFKTKDSCVIKTLLTPLKLKREKPKTYTACDGSDISIYASHYVLDMFRKPIPFVIYFFAKFGVEETFKYFGLEGFFSYVDLRALPTDDNIVCFKINKHTALCLHKVALQNHQFMGSVATLLRSHKRNMTIYDAYNQEFWQSYIGEL